MARRRIVPPFLEEPLNIPAPEKDPMRVGVTGRHPALDFPEAPPPLVSQEVPPFAPTPVKTTAETRRLLDLLAAPPVQEKPGVLRRILAGAAGGSEGYFRGARAGIETATEVLEQPYKRAVERYGQEVTRAGAASKIAEAQQEERRKREEQEYEASLKGVEERRKGEEAVTSRAGAIARTKDAAATLKRLQDVGRVVLDEATGEYYSLPKFGGPAAPTGIKGATEKAKAALRLKNQLTVLRNIPKFFNIPATAYGQALQGQLVAEFVKEPALQNFFEYDEKAKIYVPRELDEDEMEDPYDDARTKGQAYEELINRLNIQIPERLGATKAQKGGITTKPGERYRIVEE